MRDTRKVIVFAISSFLLLIIASLLSIVFKFSWEPFNKINLLADIIKQDTVQTKKDTAVAVEPVPVIPEKNFDLYLTPSLITSFLNDSVGIGLPHLMSQLRAQDTGNKRKIRIAYFGDSMIEGDLLTQTIRELMKKRFGGRGVGFVPITSQVSKFRQTVTCDYSGGWQDLNFKSSARKNRLFLSGHLFSGNNQWVQMTDQTLGDSVSVLEKYLLAGPVAAGTFSVNGQAQNTTASTPFNQILIGKDVNRKIEVRALTDTIPVYGISFESADGVIVDNFSFRGITGVELNNIDTAFLKQIAAARTYDLIVFQYGVNLLFRPNDMDFSWYGKLIRPVMRKFKTAFPNSDLLIISTADRAFRYGEQYQSAKGIDSLIKTQALLAYEEGWSFYNLYATMGGRNSIVRWAQQEPPHANKDYVHPNQKGAEVLGRLFFEAVMQDYNKQQKLILKK